MPRERAAVKLANEWLLRSRRDLVGAQHLLGDDQLLGLSVFHSQQAAEKALKGFLASKNRPVPRTHDLAIILEECGEEDREFLVFRDGAAVLNPYAVAFRYPGSPELPTDDEANQALSLARDMVDFVAARIPGPVNP